MGRNDTGSAERWPANVGQGATGSAVMGRGATGSADTGRNDTGPTDTAPADTAPADSEVRSAARGSSNGGTSRPRRSLATWIRNRSAWGRLSSSRMRVGSGARRACSRSLNSRMVQACRSLASANLRTANAQRFWRQRCPVLPQGRAEGRAARGSSPQPVATPGRGLRSMMTTEKTPLPTRRTATRAVSSGSGRTTSSRDGATPRCATPGAYSVPVGSIHAHHARSAPGVGSSRCPARHAASARWVSRPSPPGAQSSTTPRRGSPPSGNAASSARIPSGRTSSFSSVAECAA